MGLFDEISSKFEEARILENQECPLKNNSGHYVDSCVLCCKRRIQVAELKGETPSISDIRMLKFFGEI